MYKKFGKRLLDMLLSFGLLVLTSPLLVLTIMILAIQNQGSPFFIQERPGKNHRPFRIIKLKTMNDRRDQRGDLLPDKVRMTTVGRFVRKLSLDELPQLINVLRGEMSLIGPRPLLFKYIPLYSNEQNKRHNIKPGITGWAQVNGRNSISWQRKFELDVYYVDNLSFALDCKIIWMTIVKVIKREGINQSDQRPMEPFNGQN